MNMADVPQTIGLDFNGYWRGTTDLPATAGIYCVYTCENRDEKTVAIDKLQLLFLLGSLGAERHEGRARGQGTPSGQENRSAVEARTALRPSVFGPR
jgi:hypothetical protein